jgi:predicted Zn-dependent protease
MLKKYALLIFLFFLCGCATTYNPATGKKEMILINDSTEVNIGKNVASEIIQQNKTWNNPREQARVERIGKAATIVSDRANISYEFYLLDDKELNAFSLPGGFIFVNRGLLERLNDDELAFVLGHEIGHVAAKHAVKAMQSGLAFQTILAVAFAAAGDSAGNNAAAMAQASGQIYNLITLGYSRKDEYFADQLGAKYAFKAGFNPYASISSLEKICADEGSQHKTPAYLRTHPYPDDRIRALQAIIPKITGAEPS